MPDSADMADRTPLWGRHLVMAVLIVWALVFVAVVLSEPYVDVLIAMLIVSAFVVVATVLIGHYPIIGTLAVALVVAVFVGLFFLRNALRTVPVDAAYPSCSAENLESLAESLGTPPTAEAVARAYVPWARNWGYAGTYEDCLQGFRAKR